MLDLPISKPGVSKQILKLENIIGRINEMQDNDIICKEKRCHYLNRRRRHSYKVSLLEVVALWDDCTFIPAHWASYLLSSRFVLCSSI